MAPTRPVKKKLKLLVAWAMCSSIPIKKIKRGASKMPPTPTVPIRVPVNKPIKMIFNSKVDSSQYIFLDYKLVL